MNENKVKWVRKANMWMVLTWRKEKDRMIQIWDWFITEPEALKFLKVKEDES